MVRPAGGTGRRAPGGRRRARRDAREGHVLGQARQALDVSTSHRVAQRTASEAASSARSLSPPPMQVDGQAGTAAAAQAVHAAIDNAARLFRVLDTYRAHFCCCGVPKGYVSSVLRKLEPMHRLLQAYRCLSARPLYIMIGGGLAASRQTVCSISGAAPARPAARQAVGRPLAATLGWRRALSSAAAGKQHASPSAATAAA